MVPHPSTLFISNVAAIVNLCCTEEGLVKILLVCNSEMNYSVQQRVFMYDSYVKYSSWKKCVQKFSRKYPGFTLPSKSTIYRIVRQVHRTGTVLDKKRNRRRHVLTEEVLDDIGAQLEANPNISMRKVALQCGVSKSSAHVARILLNKQSLDCEVRSWYVVIFSVLGWHMCAYYCGIL